MKRIALATMTLVAGPAVAQAGGPTCKAFHERFTARLDAAKPPLPRLELSPGKLTETTPHITHALTGSDGLTGNVECFDHDALREVDLYLDLKAASPVNAAARVRRLRATATAALCAIAPDGCGAAAAGVFSRVDRQLAQARRGNDPLPSADETADLTGGVVIDASATPDTMQLSMFLKAAAGE